MPGPSPSVCFRFDRAELQARQRRLVVDGKTVALAGRAFDLLLLLVERAGDLVRKDEILDRVWAGVVVEENNLQVQISTLRKVLGGAAIETVPGQGYRFTRPVTAQAPETALVLRRDNLLRQLTSFIARDGYIAECRALLERTRLLTVTGVGGLGKTRLSQEVAGACMADYPDGVWFVDLAPVSDPGVVAQAVALVVGVTEQAAERMLDVVKRFVQDRRMLVILDNCEHLLRSCAQVSTELLRGSAHLKIIATSREPLHVPGETICALSPLSFPMPGEALALDDVAGHEAVRLFVERARAIRPEFELTQDNVRAVSEICARLDGIPLAIELAAARVRVISVEGIAQRMGDRFRLLKGTDSTAPTRQQTLQAAIDWSYNLLTGGEQAVLQRLAVFAGGWTLEAAEEVCTGGGIDRVDVFELHSSLIEKSLVVQDVETSRFRLLETVRQYALTRLEATTDAHPARDRHLAFHVAFATQAEQHMLGPEEDAWCTRCDEDRQNLLAAYAWSTSVEGGHEATLRLVYGLRRWMCRTGFDVASPVLGDAFARSAVDGAASLRCRGLIAAGFLSYYQGHYDRACRYGSEALALAREIGDLAQEADALTILGSGCLATDKGAAERYLLSAGTLAREAKAKVTAAEALNFLAELYALGNRLDEAERRYTQALDLANEVQSATFRMVILVNLARIALSRGTADSATECLRSAIASAGEKGLLSSAYHFVGIGAGLAAVLGDWQRAARFIGSSNEQMRRMSLRRELADERVVADCIASIRARADPDEYARAEASGSAADVADVLEELRDWLDALSDRPVNRPGVVTPKRGKPATRV